MLILLIHKTIYVIYYYQSSFKHLYIKEKILFPQKSLDFISNTRNSKRHSYAYLSPLIIRIEKGFSEGLLTSLINYSIVKFFKKKFKGKLSLKYLLYKLLKRIILFPFNSMLITQLNAF